MKNICVITGGGSGIGLSTAKIMGKNHSLIISGRNTKKLESAIDELRALGIQAEAFPCDVSDRVSVQRFAEWAAQKGNVTTVVHSAGISPNMGTVDSVFNINAMGTIYMNEEFSRIMNTGGCIIDIASMSAYLLPYLLPNQEIGRGDYYLCSTQIDAFQKSMLNLLHSVPEDLSVQVSYALAKDFVIWYAAHCACAYGKKGIRVLSVSPGTFDTEMGKAEGDHASSFALRGALGRIGQPEEIAHLLAFAASDSASYLTGTDILCDGGAIAAMKNMQK